MENLETNTIMNVNNEQLSLEPNAIQSLDTTSKWTYFLAILGFIVIAIILAISLFSGSMISRVSQASGLPLPGILFFIFYLIMAVIYLFPIIFLFQFSTNIKKALLNRKSADLSLAFRKLMAHFRYVGILVIIILSLYALIFLVFAGSGAMSLF